MDNRMRAELDRHITGVDIYEEDTVLHKCRHCGTERKVPMFYELGGWFYPPEQEDNSFCCGDEMEAIF